MTRHDSRAPAPTRVASFFALRTIAWLAFAPALVSCSKPADAPAQAPSHPGVTVAHPLKHFTVTWDRFTGRLQAVRSVEIRAQVSGYLDSIHFAEGQIVRRGDLLFTIDPRPYAAALAHAEAERSEATARVAQSEAALTQAQAEERAAESVLSLARNRLDRAERAAETNAVAGETVDIRASELSQADAAKQATTARVAAAEAAIATAKAGIETAEASIVSARIDLDFTSVRAPITGRIGQRLVHEGNLVRGGAVGTTLLTTIVSIDPIHCYFDADEQELLRYTRLAMSGERKSSRDVRNPVYLALQDEKGHPHLGQMDFVDNQIDPGTGTIRGRAIFPNPDGLLIPGLFATVRLAGSARQQVLLVPDAAILTDQSERLVYVVGAGEVVERRTIELGPIIDGMRSIKAGLDGSERVVIRGLQRVRPGSVVTPTLESIEGDRKDDGLPDDYSPVPRENWLTIDPAIGEASPANGVEQSK